MSLPRSRRKAWRALRLTGRKACRSPDRPLAPSPFDIGDFELLLALVSTGHHLPGVLGRKASGPYRRLEIARFAADELRVDSTVRLPVIEEHYGAIWQELLEVLRFNEHEPAE